MRGSGPRYLQAMATLLALLLPLLPQASPAPGESCMIGFCGFVQPFRPVPPGLFFLAIGVVALGIAGLKRRTG